ncbi:MAG TPA: peptidase M15 [Firmicutes bacterium]|jgi:D-alanyl-D-alanine carboxypeptidase|nr:peptidase M15 [Bacillota bacterium]
MIAKLLSLFIAAFAIAQGGMNACVDQTSLGGNLYLVNRTFQLAQDYVPPDLIKPAVRSMGGSVLMRQEAASALEAMFEAARADGHILVAVSGYRSFDKQHIIYRRKVASTGAAKAGLLVADPGSSEHQLGLAMDLGRRSSTNLNQAFGRSGEGQWVRENAHRFGFIVRYKAEWTEVTGIADEPWHIRYVGLPHAAEMQRLDIPLEQYVYQLSEASFGAYFTEGFGG